MQDNNLIECQSNIEMKTSFIDYAMSVIVARALPGCSRWFETCSPSYFVRNE